MNDRTTEYRKRCKDDGRLDIIAHQGIHRIGDVTYGNDGMLYVRDKNFGPYMVCQNYGYSRFVIRYNELGNVHRFEEIRWKLLLHIQKLTESRRVVSAQLKKVAKGGSIIGFYANQWHELTLEHTTVSRKPLKVDQGNVLDVMERCGRSDKELKLVSSYLRNADLVEKYWRLLRRVEVAMVSLLRDLNPDPDFYYRQTMTFTINGRTYFDAVTDESNSVEKYWPRPSRQHKDLDEARYVPEKSPSMTWMESLHSDKDVRTALRSKRFSTTDSSESRR